MRKLRGKLLRTVAFVVLLAGLGMAAWVDHHAQGGGREVANEAALAASPLAPDDSKHYGYQTGQIGGSVGTLLDRGLRTAEWALHGRSLAVEIAVLSFAAAAGMLVLADRTVE